MDTEGVLSGTLTAIGGAKYKSNSFKVTMNDLSLGFRLGLSSGFLVTGGSGSVTIDEMKGTKRSITLGLGFSEGGNCTAEVSASEISAFTMTLEDIDVVVNFSSDFDMFEIDGSLKAKHNKFDVAIGIEEFNIKNGVLTKFKGSGEVKYNGFKFVLENAEYDPSLLKVTAKVEINTTGTATKFKVDEFTIDEDGVIKIKQISGEMNKGAIAMNFQATFDETRFQGDFSGDLKSVGIAGKLDIGSAGGSDSYNFAYLKLDVKLGEGVALGNSGLKLTEVGGQAGYNYKLTDLSSFGTPEEGIYLLGLQLAIADVASFTELKGTSVIQFGNGSVALMIKGDVNVLKNNVFLNGNMNVNYELPEQKISGSLGTVINVPGNGFVFKSNNLKVNFDIGDGEWSAAGSNMGGKMFNVIDLSDGNISLNGSLSSPLALTGSLSGKASAEFNQTVSLGVLGNQISGTLIVNLNSNIQAFLNESGLNGSFGVHVDGSGTLALETWISSESMTVSGESDSIISMGDGGVYLSGNMTVYLPTSIPFWGNSISVALDVNI